MLLLTSMEVASEPIDSASAQTPKMVNKNSLPTSKTTPKAPHGSDTMTSPSSTPDSTYLESLPDKPVQLVRPDPQHHLKLEIVEENVKHLHHIKTAVAVIAVVGKFHSGKSFLLNQLMGKTEGFGIGPYVRPQTMGIWMWGKVGVV